MFENTVDPDQLASDKAADQVQRCFPLIDMKIRPYTWNAAG